MKTMQFGTAASARTSDWTLPVALGEVPSRIALGAIVLVAAILRFANIGSLGYDNSYYAAGVEAMLQSWHNFFFVAAEPGGSVSIDKPPVGFWLQAISAHFLGVNSLGLLLPQILAGIISVIVVYHLVRRSFGTVAGLIAALALAAAPISVATDRNNTIDSTLILTLLLAAWAFIVATERRSLKHLLLGSVLVGVGFNIKMMEAFLPLPAFYGLYFLGSTESIRRKLANLSIATVVLLVVSLSWAVAVDLTPASQRPHVGSSGNNSELGLALGYNGVERLLGMNGRGGLLSGLFAGSQAAASAPGGPAGTPDGTGNGFQSQTSADGSGAAPQGSASSASTAGNAPAQPQDGQGGLGGPGGGGMFNTGNPGPLRLFTGSLGKDIGWLLPFGLFSTVFLAFRSRLRWPVGPRHRGVVLWGGWLATGVVFFSVAGFFHEHYLTLLAPPLAALVGIGVMELWGIRGRHPWIASALTVAAAGGTFAFQVVTARAFTSATWWVTPAAIVLLAGAALLAVSARRSRTSIAIAGFGCIVAAMLVTPAVWSGLTSMDPSTSGQSPYAYSGEASGAVRMPPGGMGSQVNQAMLNYLQANTQGTRYLMVVASSQNGADYVLATGRPVLYAGGFSGSDQVVTADDLTRMAAAGEFKYIYWGGMGGGPGGNSDIASWIAANTVPATGFGSQSTASGTQDGTTSGVQSDDGGRFQGPGGMQQGTLYQVVTS